MPSDSNTGDSPCSGATSGDLPTLKTSCYTGEAAGSCRGMRSLSHPAPQRDEAKTWATASMRNETPRVRMDAWTIDPAHDRLPAGRLQSSIARSASRRPRGADTSKASAFVRVRRSGAVVEARMHGAQAPCYPFCDEGGAPSRQCVVKTGHRHPPTSSGGRGGCRRAPPQPPELLRRTGDGQGPLVGRNALACRVSYFVQPGFLEPALAMGGRR